MPATRLAAYLLSPFLIAFLWLLGTDHVWHVIADKPFAVFGWYDGFRWWGQGIWPTGCLLVAPVLPTIFLVLGAVGLVQYWRFRQRVERRLIAPRLQQPSLFTRPKPGPAPIVRGLTDNHGHSDWRSMEDTRKLFPGPRRPHGGIVAGEAYRVDLDRSVEGIEYDPRDKTTWGLGGKAGLLINPCTVGARAWHSGLFAPSGSGKSSELVSKVIYWTGSSVVFDPTIELGPLLDRALRKQRKRVYHVGIPDPRKGIRMTGYNTLAWIDVLHPEADLHLESVVSWIYDAAAATAAVEQRYGHTDPFFSSMGRALVTCLLADLVWSDPAQVEISLATFAAGIATPETEMVELLNEIQAKSRSIKARRLAASLMGAQAEQTFSGIYLNAVSGTRWLFNEAISDMLSVGDFDPRALLLGDCTVFLNIGEQTILAAPMLPSVIVGSILNTIFSAEGRSLSLIALFFDEMDSLKTLDALRTLRDRGRHHNLVLHGIWQSLEQLRGTWGQHQAQAWLESFSWVAFAGIRASGAGRQLTTELGGYGVLAFSEGDNQGQQRPFGFSFGTFSHGQNVNVHEIAHPLMTAAQLQQDMRADEQIIIPDNGMPIRCGRAFWYRRAKLVALLEESNQWHSQKTPPPTTSPTRAARSVTFSRSARNEPPRSGRRRSTRVDRSVSPESK